MSGGQNYGKQPPARIDSELGASGERQRCSRHHLIRRFAPPSPQGEGFGNGRERGSPAGSTRGWIIAFGIVFLVLAGIVAWQYLGAKPAGVAEVWADGKPVRTLDLSVDGEYRIESAEGWNVLTVRDGRLAVTAASCPDGDCVRCGERNADPPIVCLPNRVSIRFTEAGEVDGIVR